MKLKNIGVKFTKIVFAMSLAVLLTACGNSAKSQTSSTTVPNASTNENADANAKDSTDTTLRTEATGGNKSGTSGAENSKTNHIANNENSVFEGTIATENARGYDLSHDYYDSVQAMFPEGVVYTEEYNIEGDSGDEITAVDAAVTLTWDKLTSVYDVYNSVEDPIYITLVNLHFVGGEECYIFQVNKAQSTRTLYAVGYSGNIYEDFLFN